MAITLTTTDGILAGAGTNSGASNMRPSAWLTLIKELLREAPLTKRFSDSRLVEHFGLAQERFYEDALCHYYAGLQASTTLSMGDTTDGRGSVEGPEDFHSLIYLIDGTDHVELTRSEIDEDSDPGFTRDMSGLFWYVGLHDPATSYTAIYNKVPPYPHQGTAQAAAATTITLATSATYGTVDTRDDYYTGAKVEIISGTTGAGQISRITDYNGSTKVATVNTWGVTPTGTIVYFIRPVFRDYVQQYLCWDTAVHILTMERQYGAAASLRVLTEAMYQKSLSGILKWNKRESEQLLRPAARDRG